MGRSWSRRRQEAEGGDRSTGTADGAGPAAVGAGPAVEGAGPVAEGAGPAAEETVPPGNRRKWTRNLQTSTKPNQANLSTQRYQILGVKLKNFIRTLGKLKS